ncbi:MAG: hypothetical protein DMF85_13640 [Acidobacteria bacterium]|nr:MAG: hypothetical protein DMF85_13640 [Acidobacteriota bacterium]
MPREALALAAGVLIALGTAAAQQPSARGAMPLPARAAAVASALGLPRADPALLPIPSDPAYFALQEALGAQRTDGDEVPLPLTPAIWRTRLLRDAGVADERLAPRIFTHRDTALLYYGLYAMDDPTLAWIASHEEVLDAFKCHPGLTAAFGRSIRIRDGTVVTPGSPGADAIWGDLAAAQPGDPAAFIARLFESHAGRLALLYDAVAQLDAPHQRFALIAGGGIRARALLQAVIAASPDWVVEDRPLFRPPVDVALLLRAVRLDDRGGVAPPAGRALWEQICDVRSRYGDPAGSDVDAAWLGACILDAAPPVARTRLTAFLFAQRAYAGNAAGSEQARLVEVVRAVMHYPALILTLERSGVGDLEVYEQAARRTASIERLRGDMPAAAPPPRCSRWSLVRRRTARMSRNGSRPSSWRRRMTARARAARSKSRCCERFRASPTRTRRSSNGNGAGTASIRPPRNSSVCSGSARDRAPRRSTRPPVA